MDLFDSSQPFGGLAPLVKISSDQEQSDSEDELGLSSLADYDNYAHMNIPENLKNILRMDSFDVSGTQDDTESDNDSVYKTPSVNIEHLNAELANKNKFTNFPLKPTEEQVAPKKKLTKPREKKKRRDKGKKIDILDQTQKAKTRDLNDIFKSFADEQSDEEEPIKKRKKKGRKTRKQINNELKVDENGERLVRTTEFLNTDSDESSDNEGPLSKKQELEMLKEAERARRSAQVKLTPVYNVKSFEEFVKKREERETMSLTQLEQSSQQNQPKESIQISLNNDSSDDDLVIINDPNKLLTPDRPHSILSPVRQTNLAFRNHNKSLLSRITNEGYAYRKKMEEAAKARGQFTSATERAKKLLEKEKNALLIDAQIKMHFERNKQNSIDEDDEDEDYKEEEDEEDDYLNQLSGQDEEDEDNIEEGVNKRKMDNIDEDDNNDEDDDEGDLGTMAMRRWKNKKIRKSIFDESDEEDEVITKKKSAPIPAHSISNFFKAKEAKIEEPIEDKPLGRLKRRTIQPDIDIDEEEEDLSDGMDIDEPVTTPKPYTPKPIPNLKEKNEYFEEEAEEEEDEFFGAGGEDIDNGENLDEFEEDDLLVHENNEHIDEGVLRDAFNKHDAESDHNMIQRLLKDVTGGGLRKQKAAAEAGLMLDDIDLYDDEDNDLIAIRRAAEARRRRLLKKKGGDPLENLMNDPKTSAFAKAAQAIPGEEVTVFLSDSEQEEQEHEEQESSEIIRPKLTIQDDDDEEEEKEDLMDIYSEEEDLVVSEFDPMASPLRVGLLNTAITSADDDDEKFQIEAMQTAFSPLNNRRTKSSIFNSPVNANRFKRLTSETTGHLTETPRVGFGINVSKAKKEETKEPALGSIGGFVTTEDKPKKSKLSVLSKKENIFKYA